MYNQTIKFKNKPKIIGNYSIVGPKEGEGNFGSFFHHIMKSDKFNEKTYEKAERKMVETALNGAIASANLTPKDIDLFLAGDLLNQIISSSYAARSFDIPYLGLFGACSTMAESLAVGACIIDGKFFNNVACATVSHFSTAERQFRFPLELGNQRPPTSQWTATASGCSILSLKGEGPYISMATFGKVTDWGINDVNNMGAAMAPAAMTTLVSHFKDTDTKPDDYDLILTGDLGKLGEEILIDLLEETYALLQKSKRLANQKEKISNEEIEQVIKKTSNKIADIKSKQVTVEDIKVNDIIFLDKYQTQVKILEISGSNVTVDLNGMKMKMKRNDIVGHKVEQIKPKQVKISDNTSKSSTKREIILVGKRVEEALDLLEKFIDDLLLTNYDKAYIVHGRGSGQLRKAIHEYLRVHQKVAKYHLAENNDGGNAVTIIEL